MLANDQALVTLVRACMYAYRIRQRQILMCHVHMYVCLYVQLEVCQVMYSDGRWSQHLHPCLQAGRSQEGAQGCPGEGRETGAQGYATLRQEHSSD